MGVRLLSPAVIELYEAMMGYYDQEMPGLGFRFLQQVDAVISRICLFPRGWTAIAAHARRCPIKGSPYAVLYAVEKDEVVVTAISNLHRDPEVLRNRLI